MIKRQVLFLALGIVALISLAAITNVGARVKDVFVSVKNGGQTLGVSSEGTTSSGAATVQINQVSPSPSPANSATVMPTATPSSTTKTSVKVNGKTIEPDADGNVTYHEEGNGSNVDVKVKNVVNQQSESHVETNNNVTVNVTNN